MDIDSLKEIERAPECGVVLAYLRDSVIFEKYASIESVKEKLRGKSLLEIHLFDKTKEFRAICSTSRRFSEGQIEEIADFVYEPDGDDCFKTDVAVNHENKYFSVTGYISLINHLRYDANGSVEVDNYRLVWEE